MEKWSKARAEEFLAQGYWFGSLPSAMKRSIIEHSELRQFQQDSLVYRIGDPVDGMYAILEGDFRAYAYGDGRERILLRFLGPQSWFGDLHLLDNYPTRTFEFVSASAGAGLFLSKKAYDSIGEENPGNYRQFVRLHCIHTRFLVRIALEARSAAPLRTARALLRIAKMHGRNTETGVALAINVTQSDIASLVGVSRQYMNELIQSWNEEKVLLWKGSSMPILFISQLTKLLTPLDNWMLESEGWA